MDVLQIIGNLMQSLINQLGDNVPIIVLGVYVVWRDRQGAKTKDLLADTEIKLEQAETHNEKQELINEREKLRIERDAEFMRIVQTNQTKIAALEGENKLLQEQAHNADILIATRRQREDESILALQEAKKALERAYRDLDSERDRAKDERDRHVEQIAQYNETMSIYRAEIRAKDQTIAQQSKQYTALNNQFESFKESNEKRFAEVEARINEETQLRIETQQQRDDAIVRAEKAERERDGFRKELEALTKDFRTMRSEFDQLKASVSNGHAVAEKEVTNGNTTE